MTTMVLPTQSPVQAGEHGTALKIFGSEDSALFFDNVLHSSNLWASEKTPTRIYQFILKEHVNLTYFLQHDHALAMVSPGHMCNCASRKLAGFSAQTHIGLV
jgi:hypothetical protein